MKSKEWKQIMGKRPKFIVTPFKQTKEEKQKAKIMEKLYNYMWEDFEISYSQFLRDCLSNENPDAGKVRVYWDKDKSKNQE